jgi:hypothetical protein
MATARKSTWAGLSAERQAAIAKVQFRVLLGGIVVIIIAAVWAAMGWFNPLRYGLAFGLGAYLLILGGTMRWWGPRTKRVRERESGG